MKKIILEGKEISYIEKRSKRRSISAIADKSGALEIRIPYGVSEKIVRDFIMEHEKGIIELLQRSAERRAYEKSLEDGGLSAFFDRAKEVIPERVAHFSAIMGVRPARVRINGARTRFGSCSSSGNLNFSCRVMAYSAKAVDYVVIHELAHLIHMNHSREFWSTVEKYMPDYREARAELKQLPKT